MIRAWGDDDRDPQHNMEGTTLTNGTVKFTATPTASRSASTSARTERSSSGVKRGGMAILPGPGAMFGRDFSNVELGPKS
jgi:hypothetical protein